MNNSETATADFVVPNANGNLIFSLTITDNDGAQTETLVTLYINQAPQIEVSSTVSVAGGDIAEISATINDSDSNIESIVWSCVFLRT